VLVVHYFKVRTLVKLVKMGSAQQSFNIVPFNMDFLKCVKGCLGGLPIHKNVAFCSPIGYGFRRPREVDSRRFG